MVVSTAGSARVPQGMQDVLLKEYRAMYDFCFRQSIRIMVFLAPTKLSARVQTKADAVVDARVEPMLAGGEIVSRAVACLHSQRRDGWAFCEHRQVGSSHYCETALAFYTYALVVLQLTFGAASVHCAFRHCDQHEILEPNRDPGGWPVDPRVGHPPWHDRGLLRQVLDSLRQALDALPQEQIFDPPQRRSTVLSGEGSC